MVHKKNQIEKMLFRHPDIFVDSGAFSVMTRGLNIDVDCYIEWINEHIKDCSIFASLDVIGNPEKTWEIYLYMRSQLLDKSKLIYTYHIGEPIINLIRALNYKDQFGNLEYIALGGMALKNHNERKSFLDNAFHHIPPEVKVHGFGMTDFDLLEKYPIYSADSTSWIMVGAMGNIMSDYGNISVSKNQIHNKNHYSHLPKKAIENFNATIQEFGFTLDELAEHRDNRILFNAMYMQSKVDQLNNMERKFSYRSMNKATIVKTGLELNVPYELTWSCYHGGEKACGKCGTCIDRKHAFEANGVEDPIEYE